MSTIPVTSVGQIDDLVFGSIVVYNETTFTEPEGFSAFSSSLSRVSFDTLAANIDFDFITTTSPGLSFHFGSSNRLVTSAFIDSEVFGQTTIYNSQIICSPAGFDAFVKNDALRILYYPFELSFNLIDLPENALALQLVWGDQVVSAGNFDSAAFGVILAETQLGAFNITVGDQFKSGLLFTHPDAELFFNFVEFPSGLNFRFGDQTFVFVPHGFTSETIGTLNLYNSDIRVDLDIFEFDSLQFGNTRVNAAEGVLLLDLVQVILPNAANLGFYWGDARSILPYGFVDGIIGQAAVTHWTQIITPYGYRNTQWGTILVEDDGIPRILPNWQSITNFGQLTIYNDSSVIAFFAAQGIDTPPQTQWGMAELFIRFPIIVYVGPAPTADPWPPYTEWPCEDSGEDCFFQVAYHTRWLSLHDPHGGGFVGTPLVGESPRFVYPFWFDTFTPGTPLVGRHIEFEAPFINDGGFGVAQIRLGNTAYIEGIAPTVVVDGAIWVSRSPRYLVHEQREDFLKVSQNTIVFNLLQFVEFNYTPETEFKPELGNFAYIYNVNKILRVMGLNSLRFPVQFDGVYLAGDALVFEGLDATQWGADTFIAPAIRYYTPLAWDSLYVSRYTNTVGNAARNFTPDSLVNETQFGDARVWDIRQWVDVWQFDSMRIGDLFIADAIRTITQYPQWFPFTGMGTPYIGNVEQFIDLEGLEPPILGEFVVSGPFLRGFTPRWANSLLNVFGDTTRIWNFNPQVWTQGFQREIFGDRHWISHAPRYLEPAAIGELYFPRPAVAFRDRVFYAFGANNLIVSDKFQVRNVAPDPPEAQIVYFPSIKYDIVGIPFIQNNAINVISIDSLEIPDAWIRVQGCIVRNYTDSHRFGIPFLGTPLYVSFEETDFPEIQEGPFDNIITNPAYTFWGKPRVTPHTIWAQVAPPLQARINHDGSFNPLVCNSIYEPACVPRILVTLQNRIIYSYHDSYSVADGGWVSSPLVEHGTQYVNVDEGSVGAVGIPSFSPRTLYIYLLGFASDGGFGESLIENVSPTIPDPIISSIGDNDFTVWGVFRVDPVTLFATGTAHTQWGNNIPMVHFPRHLYVPGLNATQWGDSWPSHYIRYIQMEGFTYVNPHNGFFDDFMRVILADDDIGDVDGVSTVRVVGINSFVAGDFTMPVTDINVSPYMIGPCCIPPHFCVISHG